MALLFLLLAVAAGSLLPIQAGVNTSLRMALSNPVLAAIVNFVVGLALLTGYAAASRIPLPSRPQVSAVPWWCWLGGAMGASLVLAGITLSRQLGAATFVAAIIVGQLSASVLLDHFGLVGYQQHSLSLQRLLGLALLVAGVFFVRRS